jgi:hypothetical protein
MSVRSQLQAANKAPRITRKRKKEKRNAGKMVEYIVLQNAWASKHALMNDRRLRGCLTIPIEGFSDCPSLQISCFLHDIHHIPLAGECRRAILLEKTLR